MSQAPLKYPPDTRVSNWTIIQELQRGQYVQVIRRRVYLPDGTRLQERLSATKYNHLRKDPRALEDFVIRLNKRVPEVLRTKRANEFKHAFINEPLLSDYLSFLTASIPTASDAKTEFYYLKNYALNYFIAKLNLADPVDWRKKQSLWTEALLNRIQNPKKTPPLWEDGKDRSPTMIKDIVQSLNRFITWLHARDPHTFPLLNFNPISKAQIKELRARRIVNGDARIRQIVRIKDWNRISKKAKAGYMSPGLNLAYFYGLRRSEILGLKTEDVRKGWLRVERQLRSYSKKAGPEYGPLKGRDVRNVPHWFASPRQAHEWITELTAHLLDPVKFGKTVPALLIKIGMDYTLHDFRHTWISLAIKEHTPREVMLAAGHKDLNTTTRYLHIGDEYNHDEAFVP